MTISAKELGQRLRQAREACTLTQEQVGKHLGLSRAGVAQMELGNRQVTSLELDRLAFLYGRDIRSFLADEFDPQDALTVLLRANPDLAGGGQVAASLRQCIAIGRELANLEDLVGAGRGHPVPVSYPMTPARNKWDTIQQGQHLAVQDRLRLELGDAPVVDMAEILEQQGVRTAILPLPTDVSGLTINEAGIGSFVVVNQDHSPLRRRFSLAHEYAHVLADREAEPSIVSRGQNRREMVEIRANAFAAEFLMPENGVRRFVQSLGKGRPSRNAVVVFEDVEAVERGQFRSAPRAQDVQVYDLAQVAHKFGVNTAAALFRLKNLGLVNEDRFRHLQDDIDRGLDKQAARLMGLDSRKETGAHQRFRHRFVGLALEAYRRERISRGKLKELAGMVGLDAEDVLALVSSEGMMVAPTGGCNPWLP